jgi:hypothetical protein
MAAEKRAIANAILDPRGGRDKRNRQISQISLLSLENPPRRIIRRWALKQRAVAARVPETLAPKRVVTAARHRLLIHDGPQQRSVKMIVNQADRFGSEKLRDPVQADGIWRRNSL